MIGFTFDGITSQDLGVYWLSGDRTLLPAKRTNRYTIPGKDGYYEADTDTYDNRAITGTVSFLGATRDLAALRTKARLVAQWLSGEGKLIFDDEPLKAYTAKVIAGIGIDQMARAGSCQVSFDCQPFAEALTLTEQQSSAAVALPYVETVVVEGTQDTPCIITITAGTAITNLTIERKATV